MNDHPESDTAEAALSARQSRLLPALIVNTGDGKGKTTAALGLALRAWHQGWSIGVYQFVKSGQWVSGERIALETLSAARESSDIGGSVEWVNTGQGRRMAHRTDHREAQIEAVNRTWAQIRTQLHQQRHDLYVLDEFTYPVKWGWLDVGDVVTTLRDRPGTQHVVVTGRDAPPELCEIATTITEMRKIKHPFDVGQKGQAGIEW